jgi:hypothetical protein
MIRLSPTYVHELVMDFLNDQRRGLFVQVVEHPLQLSGGPVPLANPHEEPLIPRFQVCPPRHGAPIFVTVSLDFGHSPRTQIAGKWQPAEGFMAGAWEAKSFRDVYLPTRPHRISGRRLPALAWSAKGQFLNGQSRV